MLDLFVKDGSIEELKKFLKENLPETRAFDGCQGVHLYSSDESPLKLVIHEKWNSEDAYKKYLSWRMKTDSINYFLSMLSESLNPQFYHILDE